MTEWQTKTVGEITDTQLGKMLNKGKQTGENTIPYLRSINVQWGRVDTSDLNEMDILPHELEKFTVQKGDLLICEGGESGRVAIWEKDEQIGFQNALHRVRAKNEVTNKYLFYYFEWLVKNRLIEHLFNGITIKHFPQENLRSVEVSYPPIAEQHKIVELLEDHLSRLDAALADLKQAKLKAAQFRRSLLKSTFEEFIDHSVRIGDVVTFNRKKPVEFKNSKSEVSFVPMPKVSEVSGQILLDECISHSEGQRRSLTYFENGDVIFAKITPCMENGKIALAKSLLNGAAYGSTEFHVLTPTERILPDYLRYFIGSDDFRANAERAMTGAVGQRRVPKKYLEEHAIPLPSIDIQVGIVANLDEGLSRTDEAVKVAEKIEKEAARFRRSLLQAAFTGQLTNEVVSV